MPVPLPNMMTVEQIRQFDPRRFIGQCVAEAQRQPTIRIGSRGDQVRVWQRLLQIPADAIFGHGTQAATIAVQRKAGLPAAGVVGPKTWAAGALPACYAAAIDLQRRGQARLAAIQQRKDQAAAHGVGALDFSFSVVDPKSMVLGVVIGVAAGAVLFRKK